MTHDEAFIEAIREAPDDDSLRLIYADWLDDHGDGARAEFIRVQCELERMKEDDPGRHSLRTRERELLRIHNGTWRIRLEPVVQRQIHRRGFVESASLDVSILLNHVDELFHQAPLLQQVRLSASMDEIRGLATIPNMGRLRSLRLAGRFLFRHAIVAFLRSPHLTGLTSLDLSCNSVSDDGVRVIANSPYLAGLTELNLSGRDVSYSDLIHASGAAALANSSFLARLTLLNLGCQAIGDAGLIALANSPIVNGLTYLNLQNNEIGATGEMGIESLRSSRYFTRLTTLSLVGNPLGITGARALATWPALAQLSKLQLIGCQIQEAGAAALASSPYLDGLRSLNLIDNGINPEGQVARTLRERLGDRVLL